jgi:Rps23 Pro-64 3,4-dihydroxylase Tpa1-like proline 4-hydroxylase
MNEETPEFPLHHDSASEEETIASFLYLSSGWSSSCGGRLHLFASDRESSPSASIEPIENRFIAFRTRSSHWHAVEKVHGWERLSVLSLWNVGDPPAA